MDIGKGMKIAILAGTVLSAPGLAQEAPAAASDTPVIDDIVVTAQRREQNLQDVPIQVTAFGAETIEQAGISSTVDAMELVPNVSFDESFTYLNSFITVRGLAQINNADSPVAVIVDGVPQNNQKQLRMELFDIERIEILKGPQGGLYGRNALGGAINIVTRRPTNEFEGFANASYGNGDAIGLDAGISGPIVPDRLLFRASGSYRSDNGRIRNAFTGEHADFVDHDLELRGQLAIIPTDGLQIDLRGAYRDFSAGSLYDSVVASGDPDDIQQPRPNIEGLAFGHIADASLRIEYDFGPATLTSISAYTDLVERYRGDLDFSNPVDLPGGFLGLGFQAGQGQDLSVEMMSQELRLASPSHQRFRWIVGAFYLHTNRALDTVAFVDLDGTRGQYDNPALRIIFRSEDNDNDAYAVYGQFDFDIAETLTLSAALRYDRDERDQTDLVAGTSRSGAFDRVQPKITLTWEPEPDRLLYATYSTGFRSGGFNAPNVQIPVFRAERLENFEAGFKTRWLDRRLRFNGAVYFERDRDYQFFFIDASTASQIIGNLERVNIWGIELEAQARVSRELELSAALGTTDTEIRRSDLFPGFVGNRTPKTTPWTLNLGAQYVRSVGPGAELILRADYQHRARKYWQVDNVDVQRPIDIVNLRAGIDAGRWALYAFGRNVFDVDYYTDFNPSSFSGLPYDIGFRAQPATYGVEARVRF